MQPTTPAHATVDARRTVFLASVSPRRRQLLEEAGVDFTIVDPGIDDADITPGDVSPYALAMALAHLKARSGAYRLSVEAPADAALPVVLGADTIVVQAGAILGKPADEASAGAMLRSLRQGEHEVATGVAMLALDGRGRVRRRALRFDAARVRVGAISDDAIEEYAASGEWRGKAGGYNFAERQAAGWPIECDGDVATVMGLPVGLLPAWLDALTRAPETTWKERS